MKKNLLLKCENLDGLNYLLDNNFSKKIDLIYIDPPFSTNNIFTIESGRASTISRTKSGKIAYTDNLKGEDFIFFLRERLILLKELLSEKGSIYLHIDYKVGHKIKILMDQVFGEKNFRNDITRIKSNPKNFKKSGYSNVKDLILYYSKSKNPIWNEPRDPHSEEDIMRLFPKIDEKGKRYTTVPIHAPGETLKGKTGGLFKGMKPPIGRHWRVNPEVLNEWDKKGLIEWSKKNNPRKKFYYEESEGKRITDIWNFKDPQYPIYPTQKNLEMLKLIIKTSSNHNSIVLDCFCGSGSTLMASQELERKWIGIDNSDSAIKIFKKRFGEKTSFANNFDYLNIKSSETKKKNIKI